MRRFLLNAVLSAILLSYNCAAASPDEPHFTSVIHGIVFDRVTAMPVVGAQVSIDGNLAVQDVSTDGNGVFEIELAKEVKDGTAIGLYVQRQGYHPTHKRIAASVLVTNEIPLSSESAVVRLKHSGGSQQGNQLFINYLRLFGAFQVPVMLANQYLGPNWEPDYGSSSAYPPEAQLRRDYLTIEPQVITFWRHWEYKDARPIRSRVWRELFKDSDRSRPTDILIFAAAGDDRILQWAGVEGENCHEGAGFAHRECPGKYPESEVAAAVTENAAKVGFLSLIVENTSTTELLDVTLHFKEFEKREPLLGKLLDKQQVDAALPTITEESQILPRLKAHATFLWLLSIYKKDVNGYPESYMSSVTEPSYITYRIAGSSRILKMPIRKPLMESAAKILVPYGWYMQ